MSFRALRRTLPVGLAALLGATLVIPGIQGATAAPTTQAVPTHRAAAHEQPHPGAAGIGDQYFPQDGNGGIDVLSYRVKQRWQPRARTLSGTTTLRLRATRALSSFNLDFLLQTSSVTVAGKPAKATRPTRHELRIKPRTPLRAGQVVTVRVRYAGKPLAARYRGEAGPSMTKGGTFLAVNQPHAAPFWFPANDHPTDRATMDVTTTVPRGTQVVGNGSLVSRTRDPRTTTWRWRAKEPMVPYLAFVVAGPLTITRTTDAADRPTWYAVSKEFSPQTQRAALRALRRTARVTAWLETEIGRPYPWSTNGGVVVPDMGFALENQTRPVYSWWGEMEDVIVHELAHQWFGDLVAVRRWQDIWLNEGLATWFEWRWAEKQGGDTTNQTLHRMMATYPASSDLWDVAPAAPGASSIFSSSVYQRGAMALAALRNRIGQPQLATVLRVWVARTGGGTGSVKEFIALTEEITGEQLDGFFHAWLYATERPAETRANGLG